MSKINFDFPVEIKMELTAASVLFLLLTLTCAKKAADAPNLFSYWFWVSYTLLCAVLLYACQCHN